MKTGVIVNARATRIKRARWFMWRLMAKTSGKILWKITNEVNEIKPALDEFSSKGVEHLLICGGDGSVQKILTEMILRFGGDWRPAILHVPGGATNVLSKNMNMDEGPVMVIRRYIKRVIEKGKC
jgi:diacylglycerol kinase family enzyme